MVHLTYELGWPALVMISIKYNTLILAFKHHWFYPFAATGMNHKVEAMLVGTLGWGGFDILCAHSWQNFITSKHKPLCVRLFAILTIGLGVVILAWVTLEWESCFDQPVHSCCAFVFPAVLSAVIPLYPNINTRYIWHPFPSMQPSSC